MRNNYLNPRLYKYSHKSIYRKVGLQLYFLTVAKSNVSRSVGPSSNVKRFVYAFPVPHSNKRPHLDEVENSL